MSRNLVRNMLQPNWDGRKQLLKKERLRFFEARSMSLAEGVNPARVSLTGWVEDASGRILNAAQSRCTTSGG